MRPEKELDNIYEMASVHNGWLSACLEDDILKITPEEEAYLVWRDEQDTAIKHTISLWEAKMEKNGGLAYHNAETPEERLTALTTHLGKIDAWCESKSHYIAEACRDEMNYKKFLTIRATLRLSLDQPISMSESDIAKAREIRLDTLLKSKLKRGFMKCPAHPEKHASFYVTSYGYCFGCLKSWNSIDWLMEFEGMNFVEAVAYLLAKDTGNG